MNKHGGYFGNQKDMLDFSVNLNPLGFPEAARAFMLEELQRLEHYPEPHSIEARAAIAQKLLVHSDQIIMGNGATELIYLFARAVKAKKVMLLQPTFNEYERAFLQYGAQCIYHVLKPEDGFSLNLEHLQAEILENKPEVVVLCNPNNPTGSYIEKEQIQHILCTLSTYSGYLMVDESFYEFEDQPTALSLLTAKNLFLIRSMTKFYAIAGIRLGYGLGHTSLIQRLNTFKEPWTLNAFASHMVPYLLGDTDYYIQTCQWYHEEKAYLRAHLKAISFLKVFATHANFFLCYTALGSQELMNKLIEKGIYIRTCEDFCGLEKNYIRLALRSRQENDRLIQALNDIQTKYEEHSLEENYVI
ncbi:MAG: threonine-phosphate decarboxylase [Vallitaleaceae bacterium]|nr:threonine-phosphate decarboxylase [Vallitaleaceae bacterium]